LNFLGSENHAGQPAYLAWACYQERDPEVQIVEDSPLDYARVGRGMICMRMVRKSLVLETLSLLLFEKLV